MRTVIAALKPQVRGELRLNLDEAIGRSDAIAAEKAGFSSDLASGELVQIFAQVATGQKTRALELKAQGERRGGLKQRVRILAKILANYSGQRNPVNSPDFSGKETREIAAQKAGFGSEFTYRQAKTVVQKTSRPASGSLSAWPSRLN